MDDSELISTALAAVAPKRERRVASIAVRTTPSIQERLKKAAAENRRSIAREVEFRLEQSFLNQNDLEARVERLERLVLGK